RGVHRDSNGAKGFGGNGGWWGLHTARGRGGRKTQSGNQCRRCEQSGHSQPAFPPAVLDSCCYLVDIQFESTMIGGVSSTGAMIRNRSPSRTVSYSAPGGTGALNSGFGVLNSMLRRSPLTDASAVATMRWLSAEMKYSSRPLR